MSQKLGLEAEKKATAALNCQATSSSTPSMSPSLYQTKRNWQETEKTLLICSLLKLPIRQRSYNANKHQYSNFYSRSKKKSLKFWHGLPSTFTNHKFRLAHDNINIHPTWYIHNLKLYNTWRVPTMETLHQFNHWTKKIALHSKYSVTTPSHANKMDQFSQIIWIET
jgi:hypothetical protein